HQRHAIAHRPARARQLDVGVENVEGLHLVLVAADLHVVERHAPRKILLQPEHLPVQELRHRDDEVLGLEVIVVGDHAPAARHAQALDDLREVLHADDADQPLLGKDVLQIFRLRRLRAAQIDDQQARLLGRQLRQVVDELGDRAGGGHQPLERAAHRRLVRDDQDAVPEHRVRPAPPLLLLARALSPFFGHRKLLTSGLRLGRPMASLRLLRLLRQFQPLLRARGLGVIRLELADGVAARSDLFFEVDDLFLQAIDAVLEILLLARRVRDDVGDADLERLERGLDDRDHQLDVRVGDRQRAHELDRLLDAVLRAHLVVGGGDGRGVGGLLRGGTRRARLWIRERHRLDGRVVEVRVVRVSRGLVVALLAVEEPHCVPPDRVILQRRNFSRKLQSARLRFVLLLPSLLSLFGTGCNDTAAVVRVSSDRAPGELDAVCLEFDADAVARFGRRYDLQAHALPQTLTALAGGRSSMQALVYGLRHGVEIARARKQVPFRGGSILQVELALDACVPSPRTPMWMPASFQSADAGDRAALVPSPPLESMVMDAAIAATTARLSRYAASSSGIAAVGGGVPSAPAGPVHQLLAADLDADCRQDLIVLADNTAPLVATRAATGEWVAQPGALPPVLAGGATGAAAGDVDGDGNPDLVLVGGAEAHLLINDGAGRFREAAAAFDVAPTDATAVALGDLDGDGHLDAVIAQGS